VIQLAARLRSGELSARSLAESFLRRIGRLDRVSRSYARTMPATVLEEADRADRELANGFDRGPLHGIPLAIKDLIDSAGVATAAGMPWRATNVPATDATVLRRLRAAGAVILGKLALTEGATGHHHPDVPVPVNPWAADHSSGFSSSGSGVSVAAGLCVASLGSDTGGSIRIPAAFNGVTGLKPTWGRVSRHGVFPLVEYLDTIGPMARSAADAAVVLGAIAGADRDDPTAASTPVPDYVAGLSNNLTGTVIGVDWGRIEMDCAPPVAAGLHHAAEVLADRGARVRAVRLPDMALGPLAALSSAGILNTHRDSFAAHRAHYGPALTRVLRAAAQFSATDVASALSVAAKLKAELAALFGDVDLLLVPAVVDPAPTNALLDDTLIRGTRAFSRLFSYTIPFNVTLSPSITFPVGFAPERLPVAAQLVGRHLAEGELLRACHAFQSVTDWHLARPAF